MGKAKRRRRAIGRPCAQQGRDVTRDVPEELIQYIQLMLPVKEAARTCLVSKSWLHAWSTIPTLRFQHESITDPRNKDSKYRKLISRTLQRYHRDNIPVVSFDLHFDVHGQKDVYLTHKWVRKVKSSTLKELYLTLAFPYSNYSYKFPDVIFSSENLYTISVKQDTGSFKRTIFSNIVISNNNIIIRCVNLRVLELVRVHISEEVLDKIFSTCILLEKIDLMFQNEYKALKVKNLRYLQELKIAHYEGHGVLELSDVPSLRLFDFESLYIETGNWVIKDSLGSLRELFIAGVVIGNEFLDIFKSNNFPVLEILSLDIEHGKLKILDITCNSLQRFVTRFREKVKIDIQVSSPRLVFFSYTGEGMPGLMFPIIAPDQIVLRLELHDPVNHSFFLKIRETLNLSSNFKIKIIDSCHESFFRVASIVDVVKLRVTSPATNVQELTFDTAFNPSTLLDALFSICHPMYVKVYSNQMIPIVIGYFRKLITRRRAVKKKSQKDYYYCWSHLKDVEAKDGETLTSSWTSVIDRPIPDNWDPVLFRLAWSSEFP